MYAGSSSSDAFHHNNDTPLNQVQKKPTEMVFEGKYEDSETHTEKEFSQVDEFSLHENTDFDKIGAHFEKSKSAEAKPTVTMKEPLPITQQQQQAQLQLCRENSSMVQMINTTRGASRDKKRRDNAEESYTLRPEVRQRSKERTLQNSFKLGRIL